MPSKLLDDKQFAAASLTAANQKLKTELAGKDRLLKIMAARLESVTSVRRAFHVSPPPVASHRGEFLRLIIPDTHGSAIDPLAANAFLADLKRLAPRQIVLLGDHVDCGGFLAQHHTLGYVAQTDYSYAEDILAANTFLDAVQAAAPDAEIHYIEGNHERRVETWCVTQTLRHAKDCEMLRLAFAPEYLLHLKARGIRYYRQAEHYHGLRVPGAIKLGHCHFWHGVSTAKHAAFVNLSQFGGNVVYGHTHREDSDSARPVSIGDVRAWNPGCLCKLQPLWCHTRPTNWNHGYGIQSVLPNGEFMHINVPIVDGRSLLLPFWHGRKGK